MLQKIEQYWKVLTFSVEINYRVLYLVEPLYCSSSENSVPVKHVDVSIMFIFTLGLMVALNLFINLCLYHIYLMCVCIYNSFQFLWWWLVNGGVGVLHVGWWWWWWCYMGDFEGWWMVVFVDVVLHDGDVGVGGNGKYARHCGAKEVGAE